VGVIALGGLCAILSAGHVAHSPQAGTLASAQEAEQTFQARCSTCHAEHGEGSDAGASLNVPDLRSANSQENRNEFLRKVIKSGKGKMPAFGRDFSDDQIDRIIQLIRSFAAPSSQQAEPQTPSR
jgi:mono/diheme cytochrome c family protein